MSHNTYFETLTIDKKPSVYAGFADFRTFENNVTFFVVFLHKFLKKNTQNVFFGIFPRG